MFCRHCGMEIEDDSRFCICCGKPCAAEKITIPEERIPIPVVSREPEKEIQIEEIPVAKPALAVDPLPTTQGGQPAREEAPEETAHQFEFECRAWPCMRYAPIVDTTKVEIQGQKVWLTQQMHTPFLGREKELTVTAFSIFDIATTYKRTRTAPLFFVAALLLLASIALCLLDASVRGWVWMLAAIFLVLLLIRQNILTIKFRGGRKLHIPSNNRAQLELLQMELIPVDDQNNDCSYIVATNKNYYCGQFLDCESKRSPRFNIPAFLFGPFFCLYRKCTELCFSFFGRFFLFLLITPIGSAVGTSMLNGMEHPSKGLILAAWGIFTILALVATLIYGFICHIRCGRRFNMAYYIQCRHAQKSGDSQHTGVSVWRGLGGYVLFNVVIIVATIIFAMPLLTTVFGGLLDATYPEVGLPSAAAGIESDMSWLEGDWDVTTYSILSDGTEPDISTGSCTISLTYGQEAVFSSSMGILFDDARLSLGDGNMACLRMPDGEMYGSIIRNSGTKEFTFDVSTMASGDEEITLSDYGFFIEMVFAPAYENNEPQSWGNSYTDSWYDNSGTYGSSDSDGVYVYPSNTQYITEYELSYMTRDYIALIRNEIYARHGFVFQTQTWIDYFNAQWWYMPNENFDTSMFNAIESENIKTITAYEKEMGWKS